MTIHSDDEIEKVLLLTCDAQVEDRTNVWFLDTGCNKHMCGQKELFLSLDESIRFELKFENNASIFVTGKGHIHINERYGSKQRIAYMYYVPEFH